jgi:1-aminocyclopropane-1-carboxylate synthase
MISALRAHGLFTVPSSPSDHIACKVLENDEWTDWYIGENHKRLSRNYAMTIKFLKDHDVPYYPAGNAEFFVWVDLGATVQRRRVAKNGMALKDLSLDDSDSNGYTEITADIMSKLLTQKVFLASGEAFGNERPGLFRTVFPQPKECLENGLGRMLKAIEHY